MQKNFLPLITFCTIFISSLYLISITFIYPLVGVKIAPTNEKNICSVSEVYPLGWANVQGIKIGDTLYCDPKSNAPFKLEKINKIYLYKNERETFIVSYKGMPLSFILYSTLPVLYFCISAFIFIYLHYKNKDEKVNTIVGLIVLFISLSYLSSGVSARDDTIGLFLTILPLYITPILIIEYIYAITSHSNQQVGPEKIRLLYFLALILTIFNTMIGSSEPILVFFLFFIFVTFFVLKKQYSSLKKSIYFVKMKFLFWTIIFSICPFIFLSALPEIFLGKPLFVAENTALFLLLIPLSLVYVTVKNVLFDIEFFIKKLLLNLIFSLIPAIILTAFYYVEVDHEVHTFQFFLFSVLLSIVILILKDYYFSPSYTAQAKFHNSITTFSQDSHVILDAEGLFTYIREMIFEVLYMEDVKMIQYHTAHKYVCSEFKLEEEALLRSLRKPMSIGEVRETTFGYALLVNNSGTIQTYILLPYKRKMTKLNRDEKDWLKTIAHYTDLMLENLKKTEELLAELQNSSKSTHSSTIARTLFLLAEKERSKLAHDIHDSILQELISLYRSIEIIEHGEKQSSASIEQIKQQVHEQISFIRDACFDLNPPFLMEIGLIESTSILLDKYRRMGNFEIFFQCNTPKQYENMDEETVIIFYRTIQEILNNAIKHSEAKCIYLSLSYSKNQFILVYEDDGVGFDSSQLNEGSQHFGLFNIHERIKSINGDVSIISKPGNGLLIRATVPNI